MITDWDPLIDALRNELQEYGALLNLFGRQQDAILSRAPDLVLEITNQIGAQVHVLDRNRSAREFLVRQLALEQQQPSESPLAVLLPFFPEPVRPLISALIEEINNLIARTKKRAGQNQMLLARSIDLSQQILQRLNPAGITKTYTQSGRVNIKVSEPGAQRLAGTI